MYNKFENLTSCKLMKLLALNSRCQIFVQENCLCHGKKHLDNDLFFMSPMTSKGRHRYYCSGTGRPV